MGSTFSRENTAISYQETQHFTPFKSRNPLYLREYDVEKCEYNRETDEYNGKYINNFKLD